MRYSVATNERTLRPLGLAQLSALHRLRKADDAELLLYLLQLMQALKFKEYDEESGLPESSLAKFLIDRAADNFLLGNYLH